jgi:hypothetical protein
VVGELGAAIEGEGDVGGGAELIAVQKKNFPGHLSEDLRQRLYKRARGQVARVMSRIASSLQIICA